MSAKRRAMQCSLPNDDNPDTEAEVRKLIRRAEQAEASLNEERAKRKAVEKELEEAKAQAEGSESAFLDLERRYNNHLEHAQLVLNLRLDDYRKAVDMTCCVDGCPDAHHAQSPLMQYVCKCTQTRTACMSCMSHRMKSYPCDDGTLHYGFRCPLCATVATRLMCVTRADVQPEAWHADYRMPDDD